MKLEKLEYPEKYVVKMTFTADAAELENAAQAVYERTRGDYTVQGFEKGEADRAAIEAEKGEHVFWYDAINDVMDAQVQPLIEAAAQENKFDFVTEPAYDLISVNKEDGFVACATVALRPELTLTCTEGFTAKCEPIPVAEKDVDQQIERVRSANVSLVPHKGPAVKGNIAIADYTGYLNGEAFQGGSAKNAQIPLGAGRMIPGFEEGFLGHSAGDAFDINVTFPANYQARELAGKEAVFHIVLHSVNVRQIPALNADFAKKVAGLGTMEEYRAQVRAKMEEGRRSNAMNIARSQLLDQLGQACKGELPTPLLEEAYQKKMNQFQIQLQMMRTTLGQFLQRTRRTKEEFDTQLRQRGALEMRTGFALEMLAEEKGLVPTDAEFDAEIAARAEKAKKTVEEYKAQPFVQNLRHEMTLERARNYVWAHSTIEE